MLLFSRLISSRDTRRSGHSKTLMSCLMSSAISLVLLVMALSSVSVYIVMTEFFKSKVFISIVLSIRFATGISVYKLAISMFAAILSACDL